MMRPLIVRGLGLLLGLGLFAFVAMIMTLRTGFGVGTFQTERCYLEARYASHLAQGKGFSANADQPSEVAPSFVPSVVLATITQVLGRDAARLDKWLTPALIGLSGVLLGLLLIESKVSLWGAIPAALISMSGGYIWGAPCSSLHVNMVIVLGALILTQRGAFRWGGILAGLAVGAGLENFALIALIGAFVKDSSVRWRFVSGVLIPLTGLILLVIIGIIPARPLILFEQGSPLEYAIPILEKMPLLLVYGVTALIGAGMLRGSDRPYIRLLTGWGALGLLITWAFLGAPVYLPAWMGISALIALGLDGLPQHEIWARAGYGVGVVVLLLIPLNAPHLFYGDQSGQRGWPRERIPPGTSVAAAGIGIGVYGLNNPITDLSGRLDLAVGEALQRGDLDYGILRDLPDYLMLRDQDLSAIKERKWFQRGYHVFEGSVWLYQRTTLIRGDFSHTRSADLAAGEGLRLIGYAVDQPALIAGSPFRVRLDWESGAILAPFQIEAALIQAPDLTFASGTLNLLSARWRGGSFSTYHWLFPEERPYAPGMLPLLVTVKYNDGRTASGVIGSLKVKPPAISLPTQTLGLRLGETIRLQQAILEQSSSVLTVRALWSTDATVTGDYTVLLHLVAVGRDSPIVTSDGQPLYPTHVWEPGEVFEDKRLIPLADVPAGTYEVRIGLYGADGTRLRLEDGKDYYLVGTVEIPSTP